MGRDTRSDDALIDKPRNQKGGSGMYKLFNIAVTTVMSVLLILVFSSLQQVHAESTVIEFMVKGLSDDQNDGKQRDKREAEIDAWRQAIEKAGLLIRSTTLMENFTVMSDSVESLAKGLILPDWDLMDVGYDEDGVYVVVITGKIRPWAPEEQPSLASEWTSLVVVKATVPRMDAFSDTEAFVEVRCGNVSLGTTPYFQDNNNPAWNETFPLPKDCSGPIVLTVYDKDVSKNEVVGQVRISIGESGVHTISGRGGTIEIEFK
jgi:hypothetical protein